MNSPADDAAVLVSTCVWNATPDNYSSMRFLRFGVDGRAELTYAYGQTIYAVCECRWSVPASGVLRLEHLTVTGGQLRGREPSAGERDRELTFDLAQVNELFDQPLTSSPPLPCQWALKLSEPPWPSGLNLRYNIPRVFYGHGIAGDPAAAQGTAASDGED